MRTSYFWVLCLLISPVCAWAQQPVAADTQLATATPVTANAVEGEPTQLDVAADPTKPPKDDANYALMGEFLGVLKAAEGQEAKSVGLQIRPLGPDHFEALQYDGGVPGAGAAATPLQLIGRRSGDMLVLSGGPWAIFVESDACVVLDKQGNRLGRLERIERSSPTMGAQPPEGAFVLFDGSNTENFTNGQITDEGLLMQGADLIPMFQDFNLHLEFRLPYMPNQDDQERGNSGCYLQSRYEVQVLDSFAQLPKFNGCSSIYRFKSPDVNMCLPPLRWQTYDIEFTAPRWRADGTKLRNGRLTVWHNGVKTQDDVELPNKTGAGKPEEPTLLPIKLQNHKDQVRYRNVWIIDRGLSRIDQFPVMAK
ncbi:MAG: DUF1080 domain-containing protein [Planctomycetales bacterium]|nr:DUF1080 domain-containing protein [Planctomycetales bacterium]